MSIWLMLLLVLYLLSCVFLIMIILFQSGKGGGLSSLGAASQGISDAFGTTSGERTMNKITTYSAIGFLGLAILISFTISNSSRTEESFLPDAPPAAAGALPPQGPAVGQVPAAPAEALPPAQPVSPAPAAPVSPAPANPAP